MARGRSLAGSNRMAEGGNKQARRAVGLPQLSSPSETALFSSDLACLGSVVEVDSLGELRVARVLQDVWNRGRGDVVTVAEVTWWV